MFAYWLNLILIQYCVHYKYKRISTKCLYLFRLYIHSMIFVKAFIKYHFIITRKSIPHVNSYYLFYIITRLVNLWFIYHPRSSCDWFVRIVYVCYIVMRNMSFLIYVAIFYMYGCIYIFNPTFTFTVYTPVYKLFIKFEFIFDLINQWTIL